MPAPAVSFAQLWNQEKQRQLEMYGQALAQRMGPPPGGHPMSDGQLAEKWNMRDPSVTPEKVADMQAQGTSPEDITRALYPYREQTYTTGIVNPSDQVKEANRIANLANKQQPQGATPPPGVTPPGFLAGDLGPSAPPSGSVATYTTPNPAAMATPTALAAPPPGLPASPLSSNQPSPSQPALQVTGRPAPPGQPKRQSQIEGYY